MSRSCFVTGGAGFIGSHLCRALLEKGFRVTAFDNLSLGRREFVEPCLSFPQFRFIKGDLLEVAQLESAMRGHDFVFHMAANSDIQASTQQTDIDLRQGTLATYNVLETMRHLRIRQIAFASTSAVYGEAVVKPTPETFGPLLPISLYGASKLASEGLMSAFSDNFDFQVWIYRFANIVGPHSTHGAIHDFIGRLKNDPGRLKVLGNGEQRKSYLHVSDCVAGMLFGLEKSQAKLNLFNLASEGVTRVRDIARFVIEEMKLNAILEFGSEDRGWKGDVPFTWLDGTRLASLGYKPQFKSDEAVRAAIGDILRSQKVLRP